MPARKAPAITTIVPIRLPLKARRLIGRAATLRETPLSAFMRDAALAEAERVIREKDEQQQQQAATSAA